MKDFSVFERKNLAARKLIETKRYEKIALRAPLHSTKVIRISGVNLLFVLTWGGTFFLYIERSQVTA